MKIICTGCDEDNTPTHHVQPPVLPHQIGPMRVRDLFCIIKAQEGRLLGSWKEADIAVLEDEIRAFSNIICSAQWQKRP